MFLIDYVELVLEQLLSKTFEFLMLLLFYFLCSNNIRYL